MPELALGAAGNDTFGQNSGAVYICLSTTVRAEPLGTTFVASQADFTLYGAQDLVYAGTTMTAVRDLDNDGLDELLVGTLPADPEGELRSSYLLWGSTLAALPSGGSLSLETADIRFYQTSGGSQFRRWVDDAGDLDGDGLSDIVFGVPGAESDRGRAHVVYGSTVQALPRGSVLSLETESDLTFRGEAEPDQAGFQITGAGDLDGDGLGDLGVSALYNNQSSLSASRFVCEAATSPSGPRARPSG